MSKILTSYPAIGDYAIIGNCRAAALIFLGGGLDWLCLPRFDALALLDRWLQDTSLTLRALMDLGYVEEAEAFLAWMLHATGPNYHGKNPIHW